jgi:hypothetical protein
VPIAACTAARRRGLSQSPGLPRTTRDNRSQLPHHVANHDHGITGPGTGPANQMKITVRAYVSSKCRDHLHRTETCIDVRHRRQGDPSRRDPNTPARNALLNQCPRRRGQRRRKAHELLSTSRARRSAGIPGVNRTRVRAKRRVPPSRIHRCPDMQKASYAGLLLSRADRI